MSHFPIGDRNGGKLIKKVFAALGKLSKKAATVTRPKSGR